MTTEPIYPAQQDIAVLALRDLLIKKGIITSAEFIEAIDEQRANMIKQFRQRRVTKSENPPRR